MPEQLIDPRTSKIIQTAAIDFVGHERSRDVILYIDERILPAGTPLGPAHAGIRSGPDKATLVFVDDEPTASFAHACRYLLFDHAHSKFFELPARFPPYPKGWPKTYRRFGPRQPPARRLRGEPRAPGGIPLGVPGTVIGRPGGSPAAIGRAGRRLAVFFAGSPDPCHLNTMEFGYRVLINKFGYRREDIRVCSFMGDPVPTCAQWNDAPTPPWVGGGPFIMPVNYAGIRRDFKAALSALQPKPQDALFIYTSGHGENESRRSYFSSALGERYTASQFKDDLQELLNINELIVLMQQCYSGGFRYAVESSGVAGSIAFASAAAWDTRAYNDADNDVDYAWSCFSRNWFGAQNGEYVQNTGLSYDPDALPYGNADQHVNAFEAFRYAKETGFAHPDDVPQEGYRPHAVQSSKLLKLDGT